LGNLATLQSPLGDRALIGRWRSAMTPPMVVAAECFMTLRKNISQSIVNAGYFSLDPQAFDRMMLNPKA
jgi:hypothetical protein